MNDNYNKKLAIVVLIVIGALAGVNSVVLAQLKVTPVTRDREVSPGEFVSLVFSVRNNSGAERTVSYQLTAPDGWTPMDKPSPTTIQAGEKETIFINLQVPSTAKSGDHPVTLTGSYGAEEFTGTATVAVKEVKGVTIDAPVTKTADRGKKLTYVFSVKNTGNVTDTFRVEAESGHDWVTDVSPTSIHLFPGRSKKVTVKLYVPKDAAPGRDPVTVTATSTRDEDIVDEKTIYTRILPPSPRAVGGKLYAILPARLVGSFSRDLGGGVPGGNINLVANGQLGNGNLFFNFGLSDLYQDNKVDWNAFDFGTDSYQVSTGDVGVAFSQLISKFGRGISANLVNKNFSLSLVDLSGGIRDSGGSLSYERENLYLAANLANLETEEGDFSFTESFVGRFTGGGLGEIELEAGYTPDEGRLGRAFRGYGRMDLDPVTLEGEAFFIGPRFAGTGSGNKGFRLFQAIDGENYSEEVSYSYYYRTPAEVQTESTMKTDRLTASLTMDLLELSGVWPEGKAGRTLRLSGFYELNNREDTREDPTLDRTTQLLRGSLLYRYDDFEYSLTGTEEKRIDHLAGETFNTGTVDQRFSYSFEGFQFTTEFSSTLTKNLTTEETISTTNSTRFEIATTGLPYISLSLYKSGQLTTLNGVSTVNPTENLEFSLSADGTIGGGSTTFGGTLDFTYEFDLPLKFLVTKGRIVGHVFVDKNGNGKKDDGEKGVPDLILMVEDTEVASGKDGYFKFPPFTPGNYELSIKDLPPKYSSNIEMPKKIELKKGGKNRVSIPLTELADVKVEIFSDSNQNGSREVDEGGIGGVRVRLAGVEIDEKRFTNDEGVVNFRGLVPGKYTLNMDKGTLPPRSVITTDNAKLTFELAGGETKEVRIGSFQEPKRIIFGQPPKADFAYSPVAPTPGTQVNFSGGLSSDPDGEITRYEWDFQSDGQVDKTDKIVSYTFEETGTYEITLIVTDNDGNETSISKTIDVVEPE
ncbi:MAG: PKD domain-containing protein [Candidatus Bipolaricaulia bacterium]